MGGEAMSEAEFLQRMEKLKEKQAQEETREAERLRQEYLLRTGRKEYKS